MNTPLVEAALVVFREGLEAALMLGTLAAYLFRSGAREKLRALWLGAACGGGATVAAFALISSESIAADPRLHIALTLGSALLMIYLSGWIWLLRTDTGLRTFFKQRAGRAVESRTGIAIFLVAGIAIFREGAETVLFLRVIAMSSGNTPETMIVGPVVGVTCLIIAFIGVHAFSGKIPLRLLFLVTSACLFLLGIKFIGEGLALMQRAHLLPETPIDHAHLLREIGLNASWEAIIVQTMIVALALTGLITVREVKPDKVNDAR